MAGAAYVSDRRTYLYVCVTVLITSRYVSSAVSNWRCHPFRSTPRRGRATCGRRGCCSIAARPTYCIRMYIHQHWRTMDDWKIACCIIGRLLSVLSLVATSVGCSGGGVGVPTAWTLAARRARLLVVGRPVLAACARRLKQVCYVHARNYPGGCTCRHGGRTIPCAILRGVAFNM